MSVAAILLLLVAQIATAATAYRATISFPRLPASANPQALAVDASGYRFIGSYIEPTDGPEQMNILKVDGQGKTLANLSLKVSNSLGFWSETIAGMAIDPKGNLIIAGTTYSQDFPLVSPLAPTGDIPAAFVIKIDSQLKNILWSTKIGGPGGTTFASALALDSLGNIYIAGGTSDPNFPTTPGAFQKQGPPFVSLGEGPTYAYVMEIGSDIPKIVFSTFYGNSARSCTLDSGDCFDETSATALAVDSNGNLIVAGRTTSNKLPVTAGVIGPDCGGCGSIPDTQSLGEAGFVAKFSSAGSTLLWATYVPVIASPFTPAVWLNHVALDPTGNVILGGVSSAGLPVTPGSVQSEFPGSTTDISFAGFVMKLDSTAHRILFSTYFGLEDLEPELVGLVVGPDGSIWISGGSLQRALPTSETTLGEDYLAELSPDGSTLENIFTAPAGTTERGIALTGAGEVVILGSSGSLLTASPGKGPSLVGIANSASLSASGTVAPYELVTLYGVGLGPHSPMQTQPVNGLVPTSLGGVQVLFGGIPAPILSAGPTQISAIVPGAVSASESVALQIVTSSDNFAVPALTVSPAQPAVFLNPTINASLLAPAAAALNQDGSANSAANPAVLGSVVTIWINGAGKSSSPPPDGTVFQASEGRPALPIAIFSSSVLSLSAPGQPSATRQQLDILFAGDAPQMVAGISQVNFRLPDQVNSSLFNFGFSLQIGNAVSDIFTLYLKPHYRTAPLE